MKLSVKISKIKSVNQLENYWQNEDFIQLLDLFSMPDAAQLNPAELKDMLYLAITDFEPEEAAEIILNYKLSESLSPGQIKNLSHEMMDEKVAEQYPDPSFHYDLFNINQLLFKAFNGKFPNTEATILTLALDGKDLKKDEVSKEIVTKALAAGLSARSVINRLYEEQMKGEVEFGDAENIVWRISQNQDGSYEVITSKYWMEDDDLDQMEYETELVFFEGEED